ncbi:MAG: response regulator [Candidatus Rokubacteria bacterium]|nr:response regulator [Candidatus Rokubacteria bacterium]MBI3825798.1 response regulator [Candidatus Rokubacteria bacterium]
MTERDAETQSAGYVRVLLVEDDADQAELVRRSLERQHLPFDVSVARNGAACLETLERESVAVVLLDYSLPGMTGLEVLEEIRRRGLTVAVVMVTGQGDERVAVQAMKAGAADYVVKTWGYLTTLPSVLDRVLRQHALTTENAWLLDEVQRRLRETEGLLAVSQGLASLDPIEIARRAAREVALLFGADSAIVFRADTGAAQSRAVAEYHVPQALETFGARMPFAESSFVIAGPDLLRPAASDRMAGQDHQAIQALPERPRGFLYAPVMLHDELLGGVLACWWTERRAFTDAELRLAAGVASQVALAMENARLYEQSQRAVAELNAAQQQLVRGATLRALGELTSGASHHLNNLLAVVLGHVGLLKMTRPADTLQRPLDLIARAATDAAEVVRRMQRFARVESIDDRQPVDLNQLATEVLEMTRPRWRDEFQAKGLTIEARLEPEPLPSAMGNAAALREVLTNLVLNAIDAMPRGGSLVIRTSHSEGWVRVAVSDTGVGMSNEVRERALEPFFTTKGPRSTGLGLSVNYGIVKQHGGELHIETTQGRGTTMTVRLPVVPIAPRAKTAPEPRVRIAALPDEPVPPARILVIEEENDVRGLLASMLTVQGHKVIQAAGPRDGLDLLESGEPVDVVLTDLGMAEMTGLDVARAIKRRWPSLPVALVTGWGEQLELSPDDREMIADLLYKPVSLDALRALVSTCTATRGRHGLSN